MPRAWTRIILGLAMMGLLTTASAAEDWVASKLRGPVQQFLDGKWEALGRGDVVPDERQVRTLASGHVTLVRGGETVDLGPNTIIKIHDKAGAKPFTTVTQSAGQVTIEAEVQNVQHFAVQNQFLAAVVKGTRFVVTVGKTGASVTVRRGHVAVEDKANRQHVTIGVGQSAAATSSKNDVLVVTGSGTLPAVLAANNLPIVSTTAQSAAAKTKKDAGPADGKLPKSEEPKDKDKGGATGGGGDKGKDKDKDKDKSGSEGGKDKGKSEKGGEGSGHGNSAGPGNSGSGGNGDGAGGAPNPGNAGGPPSNDKADKGGEKEHGGPNPKEDSGKGGRGKK